MRFSVSKPPNLPHSGRGGGHGPLPRNFQAAGVALPAGRAVHDRRLSCDVTTRRGNDVITAGGAEVLK